MCVYTHVFPLPGIPAYSSAQPNPQKTIKIKTDEKSITPNTPVPYSDFQNSCIPSFLAFHTGDHSLSSHM